MGSGSLGLMQATAGGRSGSEWKGGGEGGAAARGRVAAAVCVRQCFNSSCDSLPHPLPSTSPPPLAASRYSRSKARSRNIGGGGGGW